MPAVSVDVLLSWLQMRLGDAHLYRPGPPEVDRLSLALEPGDLPDDLNEGAIFLHRAHRLGDGFPGLAALNSHDGFDAALTTGPNLPLAEKLHWHDTEHFESDRASGLIAVPPQRDWSRLLAALHAEFGGHEALLPPREPGVGRVALMNAMRPELLEAVSELGVNVYVTGQMRPGALPAARALGLGVIALGHRRTELWGLQQLGREVSANFSELTVQVYPDLGPNPRRT